MLKNTLREALFKNLTRQRNIQNVINTARLISKVNYRLARKFVDPRLQQEVESRITISSEKIKLNDYVILIDSYFSYGKGLSYQYLLQLHKIYCQNLIVFSLTGNPSIELKRYCSANNIHVHEIGPENRYKKLLSKIKNYAPSKAFMHLSPWEVDVWCSVYKLQNTGIKFYNIDITDHRYWFFAGENWFNINFRKYGSYIAETERSLKNNFEIPMYPVIPENLEIIQCDVFLGGHVSKFSGDHTIFEALLNLLYLRPKIKVVLALTGSVDLLIKELKKLDLYDKILILNNSKNYINYMAGAKVMLSSFPVSGGLMTQLSAYFSVPIVAYQPNGFDLFQPDSFLKNKEGILYTEKQVEIHKLLINLIDNSEYRNKIGKANYRAIWTKEEMEDGLRKLDNGELPNTDISNIRLDNIRGNQAISFVEECIDRSVNWMVLRTKGIFFMFPSLLIISLYERFKTRHF